jgi:hypothetical protein
MLDPHAEEGMGDAIVLAGLRQWSPERRLESACKLTAMIRTSSRAAWRSRHPDMSPLEADIAWAESQYGPAIGTALRAWAARGA